MWRSQRTGGTWETPLTNTVRQHESVKWLQWNVFLLHDWMCRSFCLITMIVPLCLLWSTNPEHEGVHFLLNVLMAHAVAVLIGGRQEHVQKRSSFLCALVRVTVGFNVGNVLCSLLDHLGWNKGCVILLQDTPCNGFGYYCKPLAPSPTLDVKAWRTLRVLSCSLPSPNSLYTRAGQNQGVLCLRLIMSVILQTKHVDETKTCKIIC